MIAQAETIELYTLEQAEQKLLEKYWNELEERKQRSQTRRQRKIVLRKQRITFAILFALSVACCVIGHEYSFMFITVPACTYGIGTSKQLIDLTPFRWN